MCVAAAIAGMAAQSGDARRHAGIVIGQGRRACGEAGPQAMRGGFSGGNEE